jgi:polyphosphate kinase
VTSISITLYRLAKNSQIISSLINAAKNGKKVTVQIELQAVLTKLLIFPMQMQTEGITLIFGIKRIKGSQQQNMCCGEK